MLPSIDELWDEDDEKKRFSKVMYVFLLNGFIQGVENTAEKKAPEELLTIAKRRLYHRKSLDYAAFTVGATRDQLAKEIDEAVTNGESVKQLAGRINDMYGRSMGYRSVRIARSQLTETVNDGTYSALVAEGHETKSWSTVIDGRERESHHNADGQTVSIDEPFKLAGGSGMYPGADTLPLEETILCRCTLVAGGTSADRAIHIGQLFLRTHSALERRYVVSLRRAFIAQRDRVLSRPFETSHAQHDGGSRGCPIFTAEEGSENEEAKGLISLFRYLLFSCNPSSPLTLSLTLQPSMSIGTSLRITSSLQAATAR